MEEPDPLEKEQPLYKGPFPYCVFSMEVIHTDSAVHDMQQHVHVHVKQIY